MPKRKKSAFGHIYQMKVTLRGSKPPIWRRIEVSDTITLQGLHEIIQITMGWQGYHLHQFTVDGIEYGVPDGDFGLDDMLDESAVTLQAIIDREPMSFYYLYDFGDGWEHEILVEKKLPAEAGISYPRCLKGKRACPPEDCGGIWGYTDLLEVLREPEHPEYEHMREWTGEDFDPDAFDLEAVNADLIRMRAK